MATNDLMTELQKDSIKLDDDSERKVKTWNKLKTCIVADSQWMMEEYRKYLKILIVLETWNLIIHIYDTGKYECYSKLFMCLLRIICMLFNISCTCSLNLIYLGR